MDRVIVPKEYNYIGAFISLNCNLNCSYCINLNEDGSDRKSVSRKPMSGLDWARAINRLHILNNDLPVTIQGGEPTVHKEFYEMINAIDDGIKLDLLTNMVFDVDEFIKKVDPKKFTREAKYAAIRVSYHPGQNDIDNLIEKTKKMADAGFYVGLYSVVVPQNKMHIEDVKKRCIDLGIDFRIKEYLGFDGVEWHGTYKFPEAVSQKIEKYCDCKTSELIIGPSGHVYRCHSDLYESRTPIGHILDPDFKIEDVYRPCFVFGHCNPCDIKVKTNRHQIFGHTSVEIKNIQELTESQKERLTKKDFGMGYYDYEKDREFLNG
ncbi:radical SAM protein [Sulfurimonas sp. HSL-1716]|uniref:radical SAM protein n=1 Tax=Hydrocurvibacter sulfurireducens TaxID=3131937 RepID=UPI0031F757CA